MRLPQHHPDRNATERIYSLLGCVTLLAIGVLWLLFSALGLAAQQPQAASLTTAWQPLGPQAILSPTYNQLSGRVTALAFDPADPTGATLYLGATGAGVWKSTNALAASPTFTPLTDTLPVFSPGSATPSLSIGALAIQSGVLLAGTGDPNNATDSYYGAGLLRSTDAGLTWSLITLSNDNTNGFHTFRGLSTAGLAFSSTTSTLAVAAFTTSPQAIAAGATPSTSIPGLYYSTDAGQTWHMSTVLDGVQVVQQPGSSSGNSATGVIYSSQRGLFFAAIRGHGLYSSPDGITWQRLASQPGAGLTSANCPAVTASTCPIFRAALAVQPATGDLYALTVDASNNTQGLYQDLCNLIGTACSNPSVTFANRIDAGALDTQQGTYNLSLSAAPTTSGTVLFAGTIDLYRCAIATGSSTCILRNTTNALNGCNAPAQVAPAQHAITTLSQSTGSPLVFLGNDGGLWRSTDGVAQTGPACSASDATHFTNLNVAFEPSGSLAEIVAFAQHPTDPSTLLLGLDANGSAGIASTAAIWPQLSAGEGAQPAIDPANPTNWYISIGASITLKQCTLGSACTAINFTPPSTVGLPQVANDTALLHAPTLLDPALPSSILLGTCRVWRGPVSGTGWTSANALSTSFGGGSVPCTSVSPLIRSLAAGGPTFTSTSPQLSGSTVLYAGLAGSLDGAAAAPGHVFVTRNANLATPTWTDITLSPVLNDTNGFNPSGFAVTSLAIDTHDPTGATVYAILGGFGPTHIYRSVDFGAHWTNLTSNLPIIPANALVIDPNDANTVYVALDSGVYVTTAISTCATTSCWSPFGTALPNSPVTALAAAPNMLTGDGRRGMIRASTYGRGLWQQPLLTAISLAQPAITLSAASFTFAAQQVATQSPAQTLTVTSSGNVPVTFGSPILTGDFAETDTCANQTLAPGATCTVSITFAPTVTGSRSGLLTLYANIPTGQATVSLTGVGTAPAAIVLTPLSLNFAATIVNQTTAAQIMTIANTGGTTATLQTPTITGDFALSANTCTTTLAPSTACSISIAFTPTASGNRSGQLSLTDSAGTQTAQLTGIGNSPATDTFTPAALTFPQQQVGTASTTQSLTLTNSGDVPLTLIAVALPSPDFSATNNCGATLAAHSTCAVTVTFNPSAPGNRTATLTLNDQFRSQTVTLSGIGVAGPGVSLSPTSLTFPATAVSLSTSTQTLTLTNNGGLPLTISSILPTASFTLTGNTCPTTLAASSSCTLQIAFTPTSPGLTTGTLTILSNAATQSANLSGTGIDFSLASSGATSYTITSGTTVTYPLLLSSLTGLTGNVALACTGAPAHATCTVTPSTAQLGSTTSIVATVQTGLATATLHNPFERPALYLALLLPLAFLSKRRRRLLAALCLLLTLTACGAGRLIPDQTTPLPTPTSSGTYNLTVSASAAGLTHTVPLSLTIK